MKNCKRTVKIIAFVAMLSIIISLALGFFTFGMLHSHECIGADCEICLAANSLKKLLDGLVAATASVGIFANSFFVLAVIFCASKNIVHKNPISLKVKLSD